MVHHQNRIDPIKSDIWIADTSGIKTMIEEFAELTRRSSPFESGKTIHKGEASGPNVYLKASLTQLYPIILRRED
jgi:hypothetical protein